MFGTYSHVCLQEVNSDIFIFLPTVDHVAVIDVVSFSNIKASWPTA
jgi:hypothetical protein